MPTEIKEYQVKTPNKVQTFLTYEFAFSAYRAQKNLAPKVELVSLLNSGKVRPLRTWTAHNQEETEH